ncbi:MAG: serine dehydratase, partial [Bacteroidaceae bacterium]|nr:serine dehydratase [Bacteroidaceae bacterium]
MESIKEIFRIGKGPSSSHTMAPRTASQRFLARNLGAAKFVVTLYGSLAATGKGHMTNTAILEILSPAAPTEIVWEPKIFLPFHPNGMRFEAYDKDDNKIDEWTTYSIGGGALADENSPNSVNNVYEMKH